MRVSAEKTSGKTACFHCGDDCSEHISDGEHSFCCQGCMTVYSLLNSAGMCQYYDLGTNPGLKTSKSSKEKFAYLDDPNVVTKLLKFSDGGKQAVVFHIPQIHCASCIWLLENIYKLADGIFRSTVDYQKKEVFILFDPETISLRKVVGLLDTIGYSPAITLNDLEEKKEDLSLRSYYFKLATAFFCFGNIMMLSFPEYFGLDSLSESTFRKYFGVVNFFLSLPVLLYSASEFFHSAFSAIKSRAINLDVPIVLGIIVMFVRSAWEIFSGHGAGFMDTLSSLVFLMLLGRMFQKKINHSLSFDRDYKSYFPVSVTVRSGVNDKTVPLSDLKKGDRIIIKNDELIPADSILFDGEARIDYSFVTGESELVSKTLGEIVYAGGKQSGSLIELEVVREVSQSYLTKLWNDQVFAKPKEHHLSSLSTKVSKWFTFAVILIGLAGLLFWLRTEPVKGLNAFTAVLIITCPCALALSGPFTLGSGLRILNKIRCFLKNGAVIESLANVDTLVFDKTGTLTFTTGATVKWEGKVLSREESDLVSSLAASINHPLAQRLKSFFSEPAHFPVYEIRDLRGRGFSAIINEIAVKAGTGDVFGIPKHGQQTKIFVAFNDEIRGAFVIENKYRPGIEEMFSAFTGKKEVIVITGDHEGEKSNLEKLTGGKGRLFFSKTPEEKLSIIRALQGEGKNVLMIGDGLNDAGALKQSNVGIAVTEDLNNFSPACDAILHAENFGELKKIIGFAIRSKRIIVASFIISFLYNIVGIYFALQGNLSPLIAAVLMPLSSATVILFTTIGTSLAALMSFGKISGSGGLQVKTGSL